MAIAAANADGNGADTNLLEVLKLALEVVSKLAWEVVLRLVLEVVLTLLEVWALVLAMLRTQLRLPCYSRPLSD